MTQVNKYNHSKIYKISSNLTDKIYVGSTTQTLAQRLSVHIRAYKQYIRTNTKYMTSYELIKLGDSYITLIEENSFNNRQQLERREGEIIKLNINNAVNKFIAGRTVAEYKQDNHEAILEYQKQYHNDNKEHIAERDKQYRQDNKEHIAEQKKQTTICECGLTINKSHKSQHLKSTRHINLIKQLFINELSFYNF